MTVSTSNKPPSKRVRSARGYVAYASDIGVSERTIKRWVKRGREAGDPFPLDDLGEAVAWWARNGRNTPPAELVNAAAKAKRAAAEPVQAVVAPSPANAAKGEGSESEAAAGRKESAPGKPLLESADMVAGTIEENLHRLHVIHSANLTLLEKAFQGSNEADIINRQRNAARSGEMLNAAQKAFDEYQRARGDVVPIADVKRDLLRIHSAMAQSILAIIEDLGVPRARAVAAADGWFRMLRESAFFYDTMPVLDIELASAKPVSTPA